MANKPVRYTVRALITTSLYVLILNNKSTVRALTALCSARALLFTSNHNDLRVAYACARVIAPSVGRALARRPRAIFREMSHAFG